MIDAGPPFQSDHVLVQFLMGEFLSACPLIREVREKIDETISSLGDTIGKLCSPPSSRWSRQHGPLTNLKRYVEGFSGTAEVFGKLRIAVSKAYYSALQVVEVAAQHAFNHNGVGPMKQLIDRLLKHFDRIADLMPEVIKHFRDDENVLYCLLKHREEFDEIYGSSFVGEICAELFEGGVEEMAQLIIERYRQRGFDHLISDIESRVLELDSVAI